jgi:hypothetical protein
MTQNFQGFNPENCGTCGHPRGSHLHENQRCAIIGCACPTYTAAAAPAPAPEPTGPAATKAPAEKDIAHKVIRDFNANRLEAAKLGLSRDFRQMALVMLEQVVAHEVLEFVRSKPGNTVTITHQADGEITIETSSPEGEPSELAST